MAGYTVRIVPKKIGKITRLVIQYWEVNKESISMTMTDSLYKKEKIKNKK